MLRTDAGVVQPRRNRVHRRDLPVRVLTEVGLHAVENTDAAGVDRRGGFKGVNPPARRLAADETHLFVPDKVVKAADGVGAAAHAGDDGIRQPALFFQHLPLDLFGNDGLPRQ